MPYNPGQIHEFIRPDDEQEEDQLPDASSYVPVEEAPDANALTEDEILERIDAGQPVVEPEVAGEDLEVQEPDEQPEFSAAEEELQAAQYRRQEPVADKELTAEQELLDLDQRLAVSLQKKSALRPTGEALSSQVMQRGRNYMRGHESVTRERRTRARKRAQRHAAHSHQ